jgi:cob(I)alamin adenosyltransferase
MGKKSKSLIIVHTGEGKGKTTAAMGIALRVLAHGGRVALVQFMKNPTDYKYGEQKITKHLPALEVFTMGAGFTWKTKDRDLDIKTSSKTWEKCQQTALSGDYELVIWDEINYVIDYGFLAENKVLEFLQNKNLPHVILTGRNATAEIIRCADLVTEMVNIKHPYTDQGIVAQKGIEW